MSDQWKAYWPIFDRLEQELCELTFSVALTDTHLLVYSNILSDLLLRSCSECENIAKTLCAEENLVASPSALQGLNFPGLGRAICGRIPVHKQQLTIIWPHQTLSNPVIQPFKGWSTTGRINHPWFTAYNDVKHDRISKANNANLNNVMLAIGGLFILNLWLRKEDITRDSDYLSLARKRVTSYSRFFSPASFLQPASADGMSVTGGMSTTLRNLEFRWR